MGMLVCKIVYSIVLHSNGKGRLKRKKRKELTQRAVSSDTEDTEIDLRARKAGRAARTPACATGGVN